MFLFTSPWMEQELRQSGQSAPAIAADQVRKTVLIYVTGVPTGWYESGRPLLTAPAAVAFLLGLGYALRRWRERAYFLLLVALGVPVVSAGLTEAMPQTQRLVITAPVVAVLVGRGLMVAAQGLTRGLRLPARLMPVGVALALGACATLSLHLYFGEWVGATINNGGLSSRIATELGYYLRGLGDDTVVYLLPGRLLCHSYPTLAYLAPGALRRRHPGGGRRLDAGARGRVHVLAGWPDAGRTWTPSPRVGRPTAG